MSFRWYPLKSWGQEWTILRRISLRYSILLIHDVQCYWLMRPTSSWNNESFATSIATRSWASFCGCWSTSRVYSFWSQIVSQLLTRLSNRVFTSNSDTTNSTSKLKRIFERDSLTESGNYQRWKLRTSQRMISRSYLSLKSMNERYRSFFLFSQTHLFIFPLPLPYLSLIVYRTRRANKALMTDQERDSHSSIHSP